MDPEGNVIDIADSEIIAGRTIVGIKMIRDHLGCSLHEAVDVYAARYEHLRETSPTAFEQSHEDYWEGFHS